MAFTNLFTRLSGVEEVVQSPGLPAGTHRNETENCKSGRKRKTKVEQTVPYKKQRYQAQTTRSYNADDLHDVHAKEMMHNHSDKAGHNNIYHKGQNYTRKNNRNINKQQQKNKAEGQKHQHQQKDRWRPANRGEGRQTRPTWGKGGGYRKNKNDKQNVEVKRTRFMSQEFKEQNAMLVDGRLVCRHFLWGRCIKDDECQLEHIKGYNDLVKEVCKFYVQGFCTKGESCPYMHKSFPCKFFHGKGKCSQGADCRFSHEPLNDVTNQLLCEALKRDKDLYELAKKSEQESLGQPENTDESDIIEANRTPDALLQPLRPNFYSSAETNAEKETLLCQTEELADVTEEAVPPHASAAAQPHTPLLSNKHEEPVCYSVAAVLGPQLFKPFPGFYTTPGSQESGTSGSANQSEVPYSVDAVLKSCKSVENSTVGHTPSSPTVSYTPKSDLEDITETHDEKVLHSVSNRNEVNKSQGKIFKGMPSHQVHTGLISKTCPSLTLASGDSRKQGGSTPESLKPAQRAAHEVKLTLLRSPSTVAEKSASSKNEGDMKESVHVRTDMTCSVNCKSEAVLPFGHTNHTSIFSRPPSHTSNSKHPTQLRPHLPIKPFSHFSSFTEFKGGAAVPVEAVTGSIKTSDGANSVSRRFAAKQPPEIHLHSKRSQSGLKRDPQQRYSTKITAGFGSKTAHCGDLEVGCQKTLKRPFHSLFASPITDTLQPTDESVTSSSCPKGFIQYSGPAPQSAGCTSNGVKSVVELDKSSARSFLGLFAAPLSAAPLPCMQSQPDYSRTSSCFQSNQSSDNTSPLSNFKQRVSNMEALLPGQVRTDVKEISHAPGSSNFSPNPEIESEDSSSKPLNQPAKQLVNPGGSGPVSDSLSEMSTSPTAAQAHQLLPDVSSRKGCAANSVLKTLFLHLRPYQQDGEQQDSIQISISSDSEYNSQLRKHLHTQQSTSPLFGHTDLHVSLEATGGAPEPQVRNSGTDSTTCKPPR